MATDPLPSWNAGAVKSTIVDFIARVTRQGGSEFVPPAERVATFDNDGTLWCEQPLQVQLLFSFDRLAQLAVKDPSMKDRQPFKAFLERDVAAITAMGKQAAYEFGFAVHAGMTEDEFAEIARTWFASATHPKLKRPYTECIYRPQLELLDCLRANGFKTFIVSGGGIDLMRAVSERVYGIPPEQVIGSSVKTRFDIQGDTTSLIKLAELNTFDDRDVKPQNIGLHIGRRPILAFGNSDGDLVMLRYTKTGPGARLALLLHHDDADREFAYDRNFKLSVLADALDNADSYGITVVSMTRDWNVVFGGAPRSA